MTTGINMIWKGRRVTVHTACSDFAGVIFIDLLHYHTQHGTLGLTSTEIMEMRSTIYGGGVVQRAIEELQPETLPTEEEKREKYVQDYKNVTVALLELKTLNFITLEGGEKGKGDAKVFIHPDFAEFTPLTFEDGVKVSAKNFADYHANLVITEALNHIDLDIDA